jgi:hypothetical protein
MGWCTEGAAAFFLRLPTVNLDTQLKIMTSEDVTVQPIKLPGKQVKVLPEQFPFWLCSYI